MKRSFARALSCCLIISLGLPSGITSSYNMLYGQGITQAQALELTIRVLEGEDGVNIIKKKSTVKPMVEVRDKNNLPVAGALVIFLLPDSGASGTFVSGARSMSVLTDSAGRATATAVRPVETGPFRITVNANFQGQAASTTISQTNYASMAAAQTAGASTAGISGGLSTIALVGIIVGVAAGAAAAGVAARSRSSGSPTSPGPTTGLSGTISLGSPPTLGVPQ